MLKQKSLLSIALLASVSLFVVSCTKEPMVKKNADQNGKNSQSASHRTGLTTGVTVLPDSGLQDRYYILSKIANKAITIVPEGTQLEQTELVWTGNEPSSKADLTICYFGTVTNPAFFQPGTYTMYKIQWGSLTPYTLNNQFWDVEYASWAEGAPIISWPSKPQNNQLFIFQPTGDADNSVYIRNLASGKYVQVAGGSDVNTSIGAKLEQSSFSGNVNQKFFVNVRTY